MEPKRLMWILATAGSVAGGFIPMLWGASMFSFSSLVFSAIGAVAGVWLVFKISGY